jgi:carbamoyltransferase
VALNCVVNGKITDETPFTDLYIQPAAYDGGTSVGAAYHVLHAKLGAPRSFRMDHASWGPEYPAERMRAAGEAAGLPHDEMGPDKSIERAADVLADGGIVGWYQGRVEFGPRALGNRSILADPRRDDMQDILNARAASRRRPTRSTGWRRSASRSPRRR